MYWSTRLCLFSLHTHSMWKISDKCIYWLDIFCCCECLQREKSAGDSGWLKIYF